MKRDSWTTAQGLDFHADLSSFPSSKAREDDGADARRTLLRAPRASIPPNRVAAATDLAFTLRTLAGSFATSLTTTWWDWREALHQAHLSERFTAFDPAARGALDQLHALAMRGDTAFALIERSLVQQAYMLRTNDMFWLWGWMLLALIALT